MKRIAVIIVLTILSTSAFCQKKRTVKKTTIATANILTKTDNLSLEIEKNKLCLYQTSGKIKDSVMCHTFDVSKTTPSDGKITAFKTRGIPLYLISWTEQNAPDSKLKNEQATTVFNEIWDVTGKKQILANNQTTTKISEIVFLDKNKTVSETQQKTRKEGFEFTLTPEGDVILKNKTQENKMTYSVTDKKYISTTPARKK